MRVRLDTLSNKIRDKVTKGKDKVTDQQIEDYYNKNKAQFAQPERRDLSIVLTKTKAQGRARPRRRSSPASRSRRSPRSTRSTTPPRRRAASCRPSPRASRRRRSTTRSSRPRRARSTGPVKTQFGYYVFEVDKVTKASQQTLEQAKPTIKQVLASQNQQKALDAFVKDFRKKWKDKTECREDYVTQDCKNAPKPTPTPTAGAVQPGATPTPTPTPGT